MTFFLGRGEKLHVTSCGLLSRIAHAGVSENAVPRDPPGMPIMRKTDESKPAFTSGFGGWVARHSSTGSSKFMPLMCVHVDIYIYIYIYILYIYRQLNHAKPESNYQELSSSPILCCPFTFLLARCSVADTKRYDTKMN